MSDSEPPSADDGPSRLWQPGGRRSRKSGRSNIFAGVNLRQLQRLFHVAGEGEAGERRARLVWGGRERDGGRGGEEVEGEEKRDEEEEEEEDVAGLAQALVGLRARARSRTGRRTDGRREPRWIRAFGHLRIKEVSSGHREGDVEGESPGDFGGLDPHPGGSEGAEGGVPLVEPLRPCERLAVPPGTSSWRSGVVRQEGRKDPERYLHHVLH